MTVTVRVPTTLRTLTAGASEVEVTGAKVSEVLDNLESAHPGFAQRLLDDDGALRRFVNVFVADDDVRFLDGLDTPVEDGQTVSIIPRSPRLSRPVTVAAERTAPSQKVECPGDPLRFAGTPSSSPPLAR